MSRAHAGRGAWETLEGRLVAGRGAARAGGESVGMRWCVGGEVGRGRVDGPMAVADR